MKSRSMKPFDQLQDDSDELDVFAATRYFSGDVEDVVPHAHSITFGDERAASPVRDAFRNKQPDAKTELPDQVFDEKGKKCCRRQPPTTSSGIRLTCLLNSFLQQAAASNSKIIKCFQPISVTNTGVLSSEEEEEEQERERKKMERNIISKMKSLSSNSSSSNSSIHADSNSCRYYFNRPDPLYDQMSGSGNTSSANCSSSLGRSATLSPQREISAPKEDHSVVIRDVYCVGSRWVLMKKASSIDHGFLKDDVWLSAGEDRPSDNVEEEEEGVAEMSDSSSDLFELENYD